LRAICEGHGWSVVEGSPPSGKTDLW
jgi:hypothetical protein